jgi:hypothetical protein
VRGASGLGVSPCWGEIVWLQMAFRCQSMWSDDASCTKSVVSGEDGAGVSSVLSDDGWIYDE